MEIRKIAHPVPETESSQGFARLEADMRALEERVRALEHKTSHVERKVYHATSDLNRKGPGHVTSTLE